MMTNEDEVPLMLDAKSVYKNIGGGKGVSLGFDISLVLIFEMRDFTFYHLIFGDQAILSDMRFTFSYF